MKIPEITHERALVLSVLAKAPGWVSREEIISALRLKGMANRFQRLRQMAQAGLVELSDGNGTPQVSLGPKFHESFEMRITEKGRLAFRQAVRFYADIANNVGMAKTIERLASSSSFSYWRNPQKELPKKAGVYLVLLTLYSFYSDCGLEDMDVALYTPGRRRKGETDQPHHWMGTNWITDSRMVRDGATPAHMVNRVYAWMPLPPRPD